MIEFLKYCIKFVVILFEEFFGWQGRKREEEKQQAIKVEEFRALAVNSLARMLTQASQDSSQARNIEDQVEAELRRRRGQG